MDSVSLVIFIMKIFSVSNKLDGPAVVRVNIFVRSISKIDDVVMVSSSWYEHCTPPKNYALTPTVGFVLRKILMRLYICERMNKIKSFVWKKHLF